MWAERTILGYIDPNTSQHVFSLLGALLTFLATAGGLVVTSVVVVRHRITSCFQRTSWPKRIATISIAVGVLVVVSLLVWRFVR